MCGFFRRKKRDRDRYHVLEIYYVKGSHRTKEFWRWMPRTTYTYDEAVVEVARLVWKDTMTNDFDKEYQIVKVVEN